MPRSRTAMRHLTRVAVTTCCVAALAVTQAAQAHAASRTVNFNYTPLWKTPEFDTGGGAIHFTVMECNRPSKDMTVLLRRTDGFNYDVGSETIKCRAGHRSEVNLSLVCIGSTTVRAHHDAAGMHLGEDVITAMEKAAPEEEKGRSKAGGAARHSHVARQRQ